MNEIYLPRISALFLTTSGAVKGWPWKIRSLSLGARFTFSFLLSQRCILRDALDFGLIHRSWSGHKH